MDTLYRGTDGQIIGGQMDILYRGTDGHLYRGTDGHRWTDGHNRKN